MIIRFAIARRVPTRLDLVASLIVERWRKCDDGGRDLSESEVFVLTRAVLGTLSAAALEETALLKTTAFEDALVRLILGFLNGPDVLEMSTPRRVTPASRAGQP